MSGNMNYRLPNGGSPPHNNNSNNKIECNGERPTLVCSVCGDKVHGYHFGAYTCASCSSFFVRILGCLEDEPIPACLNNDQCKNNLSKGNRADCQHCRFEKCKAVGMIKESNRRPRTLCRVCGDKASGKHYGVDSCEGCKCFFRRMLNCQEYETIPACNNNKQCKKNLSVRNRADCQRCRLEKCKDVGMSKKGPKGKLRTLCRVCGDEASGNHYGADSCIACRNFFQRILSENEIPPCKNNEQCGGNLSVGTRSFCQHCRFEKCKAVGMKKNSSRKSRPSKAEMAKVLQQAVLPSVSQQPSVDSVVAHPSNKPLSHSDLYTYQNSKQTSILSNSFSCRLETPSGDSGRENRAYPSSAWSDQHLRNEVYETMCLVDTLVPTETPQAGPLMDKS